MSLVPLAQGRGVGRSLTVIVTAVVTATLTSAFWIYVNSDAVAPAQPDGVVRSTGDKRIVRSPANGTVTIAEGVTVGPSRLAVPVAGVRPHQLVDTYTEARAGGARLHDAIDIMANAGTPVLAAAPGTVAKLFLSEGGGGITTYIRSDDGRWMYYYAHLQEYAPGLAEGQRVKQGQMIGRVGSTGNANAKGPHLHFAISRMQPGEEWWKGAPLNPYPLLAARAG